MNNKRSIFDTHLVASADTLASVCDPALGTPTDSGRGEAKPKICLAMPLYNQTKFIDEAITSLLAQTYNDFKLVIVDDSTEVAPGDIVKRYAANDRRIHYIKNAARKGMVENWQSCFKHAEGADYFAWVSDHDVWHPLWLEKMVHTMNANPYVVLVYPLFERITSEGSVIDKPLRYFSTENMSEFRRVRAVSKDARAFGKMVYGLFRSEALYRAGVFRRVMYPDVVLLHELSLLGNFMQIDEKLWFIRRVAEFSIERQKNSLFVKKPWYIYLPWPLVNAVVLAWCTAIVSDSRDLRQRCLGIYIAFKYFCRHIGKLGAGSWFGSYYEWTQGKKPWMKRLKKAYKNKKLS